MEICLLDEPVLIIKSASPIDPENSKETLEQIESMLEDEIYHIRSQLQEEHPQLMANFLSTFSLHLQADDDVYSVILESEWRSQVEEGEADELEISPLMRVVKINYPERSKIDRERKKVYAWLAQQSEAYPYVTGLGEADFLLLPAKTILTAIGSLRNSLEDSSEPKNA
ncbi:MAG: hypothetical protein SFT81_02295 [Candidatus Caenarcaniphilales bacterium]|nr:hypothetical protein [Candidatus Caenarcaniphilales bacterium]